MCAALGPFFPLHRQSIQPVYVTVIWGGREGKEENERLSNLDALFQVSESVFLKQIISRGACTSWTSSPKAFKVEFVFFMVVRPSVLSSVGGSISKPCLPGTALFLNPCLAWIRSAVVSREH